MMRYGRWSKVSFVAMGFGFLIGACNARTGNEDSGIGSETNWLGDCTRTGSCSEGTCICGICTASCSTGDACGSSGAALCASTGGIVYQAACGRASGAPAYICVGACQGNEDCEAGMQCVAGACLTPTGSQAPSESARGEVRANGQVFFSDVLPGSLDGRCLPRELPVVDGKAACVLMEASWDSPCDCNAGGRRPASSAAVRTALKDLERSGLCGRLTETDCADTCVCEIEQESGSGLERCNSDPLGASFDGWCYLAPDRGIGDADLVAHCPNAERQRLRVESVPPTNAAVIACAGPASDSGPIELSGGVAPAAVGEACILSDEYVTSFSGFQLEVVSVEAGSPSCESGICLVHAFRGRVSCPYGQSSGETGAPACLTPDGNPVTTPVLAQLVSRRPEDSSVCSCRCDGPLGTGPFCECPAGTECIEMIADMGVGPAELAGSYCVKTGTHVIDPFSLETGPVCDPDSGNCGPSSP